MGGALLLLKRFVMLRNEASFSVRSKLKDSSLSLRMTTKVINYNSPAPGFSASAFTISSAIGSADMP